MECDSASTVTPKPQSRSKAREEGETMKKTKSVNDMFLEWAEKNNVDKKRAQKILQPQKVSAETYALIQNALRMLKA